MKQLDGKTAVITGAASGLGRSFAFRFARAGMNLVLSDIEAPALDETVADVTAIATARGAEVIGMIADVADEQAVADLASESISRFGQVNILCNNAGVAGRSLAANPGSISSKEWKWVLNVNLWGVIHGHQAFLPHLLDHGDGHIVNTASMAGHVAGHNAYSVSKWAVISMTEGLFTHLKAVGSSVGVSCLCPGWVDTKIVDSSRNRPEWAASDALVKPKPEDEARFAVIRDLVASGANPDAVAELVHDAVVNDKFWIFTDLSMVAGLGERFQSVLENKNPNWQNSLLGNDI